MHRPQAKRRALSFSWAAVYLLLVSCRFFCSVQMEITNRQSEAPLSANSPEHCRSEFVSSQSQRALAALVEARDAVAFGATSSGFST